MKHMFLLMLAAAACLAAPLAMAAPTGPDEQCEGIDFVAPLATVVLKRAYENKRGEYIGVFEFHNVDLGPAVELPGIFEGTVLRMGPPDTRIEFKDLNGAWTTMLIGPVAHYDKRTDKLVVKARTSVVFEAYMFPKAMVQQAGNEFILKLYTNHPHQCVMSLPFKALRAATPVKGFVSDPVPPMPWSFPGHDGDVQRK